MPPKLLFSALALISTVVVAAFAFDLIGEDEMAILYQPIAWMCLNVPGFVEEHEAWVEVFGMVRAASSLLMWLDQG